MLDEVLATFLERDEIFLGVCVGQRLAGRDLGSSTVHLECTSCSDNDDGVGSEAADTALDVAELLHAHVRAEPALGEDETGGGGCVAWFCPGELECDLVGEDGRVPVCDVGKGSGVDEYGCSLSTNA